MNGITLKQMRNGRWKAGGMALKHHAVIIEEDTPDKALASAKEFLDMFEVFLDHLHGCCDPKTCDHCKEDAKENRQCRGIHTSKRPKRYDATMPKRDKVPT